MAAVKWHVAPALVQLRNEINEKWPKRDKTSDGSVGDTSHAARTSEHNPEKTGTYKGRVNALDIDKDGINTSALLAVMMRDPRTWYCIFNGYIYSRTHGFAKRKYTGANKHDHHIHISIYPGRSGGESRASWGLANISTAPATGTPTPAPAPTPTVRVAGSRDLQLGATGADVAFVQRWLGDEPDDGKFDTHLRTLVTEYQRMRGLEPDGWVGHETFGAMGVKTSY